MRSVILRSMVVFVAVLVNCQAEDLHVFLLMGQSNMSGYGRVLPEDTLPIPGVTMLRGWETKAVKWEPARQPIHNRLKSDQFCLAGPFARAYRDAHPGVTVGLIPVAWGGAAITEINKGTAAYADAIAKAVIAREKGVLKGVLWHQGESDSVNAERAQAYAARLKQLVLDLRADLGEPDLPFIAGNLAEFYGTGPEHNAPERVALIDEVRAALRDLPNRLPHTAFVESAGLRAREKHQVHFDRESLITLGKRYAAACETLELQPEPGAQDHVQRPDWLLNPSPYEAGVYRGRRSDELVLANGLVRRTFRLAPNAATIGYDNLATGESVIRGVKPEAIVELDGVRYDVGGLEGQPNYAYLMPDWVDQLKANPNAFQFAGFEVGEPRERMPWARIRHHAPDVEWPPKGVYLRMDYHMPDASALVGGKAPASDLGRKLLLNVTFDGSTTMPDGWIIQAGKSHARGSFENEGKVGEIYAPAHTSVYAERTLPAGTRLVETTIDVGTDKSASWGPAIALVWPDRVIKFNVATGAYDVDNKPAFGVFDGHAEHVNIAKGIPVLDKPISLRLRIQQGTVCCEARCHGESWKTYRTVALAPDAGDPQAVRIGKIGKTGGADDHSGAKGELVRLRVLDCMAYGDIDAAAVARTREAGSGGVTVSVHYELYDGIPCMSKWITVQNNTADSVQLNRFTSEILAAVEYESFVDSRVGDYPHPFPNIHVETDYAMRSMEAAAANRHAVFWESDPQYATQVSYARVTPCLLSVRPKDGPDQELRTGKTFSSMRAFVMPFDSYDRERNGLAQRRMYRMIAPWVTENPIMMHVRRADWSSVKLGIDQCADVGFEMIILTFGSGFNIENESQAYLSEMKRYAEYARSKGVEIGGYSLLASRRVGGGNDVVLPEGERPTFGQAPCLQSAWGQDYFRKLYQFYEETGHMLLEHDGSYPGDPCAATHHPGHKGYADSRWNQRRMIGDFYAWCRGKGIYLNVPDYYYLSGSGKCGMGYREVNWSLPRAQQVIHTRENIYDGTWQKTPSMGWMFVPLTQYHGGGAAATIEPLDTHIDHYRRMIQSNLALGVQACYRGPRLYDTPRVRDMVKAEIDWFKTYRDILESDMIHGRRADGRDMDWMLHVNPGLKHKGMLVAFNPLKTQITKTLRVPLYYTGLTNTARVSMAGANPVSRTLARDYTVDLPVTVPAESMSWYLIE